MRKKILAFLTDEKDFLALYSTPHPDHGPGGWYTVTGSVEEGESHEDAVKREIWEETGLKTTKVMFLNWGSRYDWKGEKCEELNHLAYVERGEIKLNEEFLKYEWVSMDEFLERINWDSDKNILKGVLNAALNNETFFKEKRIENY